MKVTQKQENFCQRYSEIGNASEAYRESYNAGNMKPETIHRKACELLQNGNVTARVEELQAEAQARHGETVDSLVGELNEALRVAREAGNPQAMCKAVMDKARLLGLLTNRQETKITGAIPDGCVSLKDILDRTFDDETPD